MRFLRYTGIVLAGVVLLAAVAWFWLLHTTAGARWLLAQAEQAVGVTVGAVEGDVGSGLRFGQVRYADDTVTVSVAQLDARLDFGLVPFSLDIVSATAHTVDVAIAGDDQDDKPAADVSAVLEKAALPFPLRVSSFDATDIRIQSGEREERIAALSLRGLWHDTVELGRLDVRTAQLEASANGAIDLLRANALQATVDARLLPELTDLAEPLDVTVSVTGRPDAVDVEAQVASFLSATGKLTLGDAMAASANVVLDGFDPHTFVDGWPAGFPVDGTFQATLDAERIRVSEAELLLAGIGAGLLVDAQLDRGTGDVGGRLRWTRLRWPFPAEAVRVRSESGDLQLAGNLDDWTVNGSIDVSTDEFPGGSFVVDGRGSRRGIAGRIVDSELLGGRAAGRVAYEFGGERAWSAELEVDGIHLDALLPDWPGRLSGNVKGRGTTEPFSLAAELRGVTGQLRGADVRADGAVDWRNGVFVASGLRIEHGESRFVLDGAPLSPEGLRFEAELHDLAAYSEKASGRVSAAGQLSLAERGAFLRARLDSPAIGIGDTRFGDVAISLEANDEEQSIRLSAVHRDTPFELGIAGQFDDWRKPLESRFEGVIDTLEVDLEDRHAMQLGRPGPLRLSREKVTLEALCIADRTGSELCATARWEKNGSYAANLAFSRVPVDIIEHVTNLGFRFDQRASGTFRWVHQPGVQTSGGGTLELTAGTVSPVDDPESTVATGEGRVDFTVRDGRLLRGVVDLPLPGRGTISGHFVMQDVTLGGASEIGGALNVDISNIRVLSKLSPLIDSASGALQATVEFAGTIDEPSITGEFGLERGRFVYLPIGLDLEDVNLVGSMDSEYRFDLSGTFRAGEGYGEIVSSADYSDAADPGLDFKLRGSKLVLINVPDVMVQIDPDIDVTIARNTLAVNGTLNVPHALIKPTNLPGAKVNESADVVIVAGELPDPPEEVAEKSDFEYQGELSVTLGDDVVIDVDLATARVTGSTRFRWQGERIPIADGRYFINGSIAAFGQVLDIAEGWVHFPKVPANEPLIRIKAEREIFGNTQVKRAGVFIDGPAQRPTVEAYTQPVTTEERALALLVTGSDFDYEQGVGAIDFGTYIAPRLFVSYGVGVFERENIISARFDLSESFGIKASSGSKESGIDLNYRFEN